MVVFAGQKIAGVDVAAVQKDRAAVILGNSGAVPFRLSPERAMDVRPLHVAELLEAGTNQQHRGGITSTD